MSVLLGAAATMALVGNRRPLGRPTRRPSPRRMKSCSRTTPPPTRTRSRRIFGIPFPRMCAYLRDPERRGVGAALPPARGRSVRPLLFYLSLPAILSLQT